MVRGAVNARLEAVLRLRVRGPAGTAAIDAIVDTGFSGSLALPPSLVASLGLSRRSGGTFVLADGTRRRFDTYGVALEWGGGWQGVVASGVGGEPLVGMRLLAGQAVRIDVVDGGAVEVWPLP